MDSFINNAFNTVGHEMVCNKIWRYCDGADSYDFAKTIFWSFP